MDRSVESRREEMDRSGEEMDGKEETFTGGTKLKELYKRKVQVYVFFF